MNKTKLIIPMAAILMLASCGAKTKEVKTIWGNTWGYTNSVVVGFRLEDRQTIEAHANDIDWSQTQIVFNGNESIKYAASDQKIDNIFSAEFIRESNYPGIVKQRNFFANNKIVVSSKEEKTVTVGATKYNDAKESNGTERINFNGDNGSYLMSACDSEGIIEQLTVVHKLDGYTYDSAFNIIVDFKEGTGPEAVMGEGFFEIAALA